MRKDNTWDEKKKALVVEAELSDYGGDDWRGAFYELWRYELTWGFAYKLELCERRSGVYVKAVIKEAYRRNVEETMDALGYKNLTITETNVGIVYALDRDDMDEEGVEYLQVEY